MKQRQSGVRISHMLRVGAQHHLLFRKPATRPISLRVQPHRVLHRGCLLLQPVAACCTVALLAGCADEHWRLRVRGKTSQGLTCPRGIPCRVEYHVVWRMTSQSVPCRRRDAAAAADTTRAAAGRDAYLKIARPVRSSTAEPSRKSMSHTRNVACAQTVRSKQPRRLWKFPELSGPYGLACRQRPAQRCSDATRYDTAAACLAARCRTQGFPRWR